MNNYYLKSFIADKEKRLKILKYNKVNITESSPLLMQITAGIMDECYN